MHLLCQLNFQAKITETALNPFNLSPKKSRGIGQILDPNSPSVSPPRHMEGIIGIEIAFHQGVGAKPLRKKTMVHRYKVLIFMFLKKNQSQSFETKLPWVFLIKAQG